MAVGVTMAMMIMHRRGADQGSSGEQVLSRNPPHLLHELSPSVTPPARAQGQVLVEDTEARAQL